MPNRESMMLMQCSFFPIRTVCLFIQLTGTCECKNGENRCLLVHIRSVDAFYSYSFPPSNSAWRWSIYYISLFLFFNSEFPTCFGSSFFGMAWRSMPDKRVGSANERAWGNTFVCSTAKRPLTQYAAWSRPQLAFALFPRDILFYSGLE